MKDSKNVPKIELYRNHPHYGTVKYTITWNLQPLASKVKSHNEDIGTITIEKPEPEITNFDDAKAIIGSIKEKVYNKK